MSGSDKRRPAPNYIRQANSKREFFKALYGAEHYGVPDLPKAGRLHVTHPQADQLIEAINHRYERLVQGLLGRGSHDQAEGSTSGAKVRHTPSEDSSTT